jgi:hypothetical protein
MQSIDYEEPAASIEKAFEKGFATQGLKGQLSRGKGSLCFPPARPPRALAQLEFLEFPKKR